MTNDLCHSVVRIKSVFDTGGSLILTTMKHLIQQALNTIKESWRTYTDLGNRPHITVGDNDQLRGSDLPAFFGPLASRVWSVVMPFSAKC